MQTRLVPLLILLGLGLTLWTPRVSAQTTVVCEQDYTVVNGEWLSTIAQRFFGDVTAYPAIFAATNLKSETDPSYATLVRVDSIPEGAKLCIVSKEDAQPFISPTAPAGLVVAALANLDYKTSVVDSGSVRLVNGVYSAPSTDANAVQVLLTGPLAYGELNGTPTAAVVTTAPAADEQNVYELHLFQVQDAKPVEVATLNLGAGTPVLVLTIANDQIIADVVSRGADDPATGCCATERVLNTYALQDGALNLVSSRTIGTVGQVSAAEASPSATAVAPTSEPKETATKAATATVATTEMPTEAATPTTEPTQEPTTTPTSEPTQEPTFTPTSVPTEAPTATLTPTEAPTLPPTSEPTATPTLEPTATPTLAPTATPTLEPTATATFTPTSVPTNTIAPTTAPTEVVLPTATNVPVSVIAPGLKVNDVTFGPYDLAKVVEGHVAPAVPYSNDEPPAPIGAPAHIAFAFDGEDRLWVIPTEAYKAQWEAAGNSSITEAVNQLRLLLRDKPTDPKPPLPFLPAPGATNDLAARVHYLDFNGGSGIAYLARWAQDPSPVLRSQTYYTFLGLTNDGKYIVSFRFPVETSALPKTVDDLTPEHLASIEADPTTYFRETTNILNALKNGNFGPDLSRLDALVFSITVPTSGSALPPPSGSLPTGDGQTAPAGSATPGAPSAPALADKTRLLATDWKWVETTTDKETVKVADPSKYTLRFNNAGGFGVTADCNIGAGNYTVTGNQLHIKDLQATLAFCGDDSLDVRFTSDLLHADTFGFEGANLLITLQDDGGTMKFSR